MKASNPTDFTLTKVIIYPNGDKEPRPITALVNHIEYVENIAFSAEQIYFVQSKLQIHILPFF